MLKVKYGLETYILMLCSALSLFWYFILFAANLMNAVSHSYADGKGISFFTATFETYGNSPFR
jgi:hypothetical protein